MKATIQFDDQDMGGVTGFNMNVFLEGGFTPSSPAHQMTLKVVEFLESLNVIESRSEARQLTGQEAEAALASGTPAPGPNDPVALVNTLQAMHEAGKAVDAANDQVQAEVALDHQREG